MFYQPELHLTPEEVLDYLRKSRTDDPTLDVAEILARHETILDEYAEKHFGGKVNECTGCKVVYNPYLFRLRK